MEFKFNQASVFLLFKYSNLNPKDENILYHPKHAFNWEWPLQDVEYSFH